MAVVNQWSVTMACNQQLQYVGTWLWTESRYSHAWPPIECGLR